LADNVLFQCPECLSWLEIRPDKVALFLTCPTCKAVTVPSPAAEATADMPPLLAGVQSTSDADHHEAALPPAPESADPTRTASWQEILDAPLALLPPDQERLTVDFPPPGQDRAGIQETAALRSTRTKTVKNRKKKTHNEPAAPVWRYLESESATWKPRWWDPFAFPFRLTNLRAAITLTAIWTLLLWIGVGLNAVVEMYFTLPTGAEQTLQGQYVRFASIFLTTLSLGPGLWLSVYLGSYFMHVFEETAGGRATVTWETGSWGEGLKRLLLLAWLVIQSIAVGIGTTLGLRWSSPSLPVTTEVCITVIAAICFPIALFSSAATESFWRIVHLPVLSRLFRQPLGACFLGVCSIVLVTSCVLAGSWIVRGFRLWPTALVGVLCSVCSLGYSRALGRTAWCLASPADEEGDDD
jgi:hypothetical protein